MNCFETHWQRERVVYSVHERNISLVLRHSLNFYCYLLHIEMGLAGSLFLVSMCLHAWMYLRENILATVTERASQDN